MICRAPHNVTQVIGSTQALQPRLSHDIRRTADISSFLPIQRSRCSTLVCTTQRPVYQHIWW